MEGPAHPIVGRWASAVALQGEAANHRGVRRLRAGVLLRRERRGGLKEQAAGGGAVWMMRGGPSQPLCRARLQTTARCGGPEAVVVDGVGKGGHPDRREGA